MPLFTPNFALPYPDGTDAPCDFAEQWCAFSDAFQAGLDGSQAVVNRTNPAIPLARLEVTTSFTVNNSADIPFDTLSADTANFVDFDADPTSITINRGGIYIVVANAETLTQAGSTQYNMFLNTGTTSINDQQEVAVVPQSIGFSASVIKPVTTPARCRITMSSDNGTTILVQRASLAVYWHADRVAP